MCLLCSVRENFGTHNKFFMSSRHSFLDSVRSLLEAFFSIDDGEVVIFFFDSINSFVLKDAISYLDPFLHALSVSVLCYVYKLDRLVSPQKSTFVFSKDSLKYVVTP